MKISRLNIIFSFIFIPSFPHIAISCLCCILFLVTESYLYVITDRVYDTLMSVDELGDSSRLS